MVEYLIDSKELASRLKVPLSWIYYQARKNGMPCTKVGIYNRFEYEEVLAWIKEKNKET